MPKIDFAQLLITTIGKIHPTCVLPLAIPQCCVFMAQELIHKGELGQLKKVMESGKQEGMQTFDLHLKELVEKGIISEEKALIFADSPSDLRLKLRGFA